MSPITIDTSTNSKSFYANDTLIYMADIQHSLPIDLKKFENFGYSNSALMLVNIDKQDVLLPSGFMTLQKRLTWLFRSDLT